MSTHQENPLRAEKRKKLHELRKAGINPYPYSYERNTCASEILQKHHC